MLPITPEEFAGVTQTVGFAVWQLQVLEQVAAIYLVLVHKALPATARDEVQTMFAKTEKRTLGQLFGEIRDSTEGKATFLPDLEALVDERNWLIHRSRHQNRKDLYFSEKRSALNNRIEALAAEALRIAKEFELATERHMISLGIPTAELDRLSAEIFRSWTTET